MADETKVTKPDTPVIVGDKVMLYDPRVGDLVLRVDSDGIVRRFRATIRMQNKRDVAMLSGKAFIAVPGMDKLNQVMGLTILTPNKISVDNREVTNPYIERNKQGLVISVTVKKIAIGYSMTGQLVAVDHTVSYNAHTLLLQSLSKLSDGPATCFLGTNDDKPEPDPERRSRWIFIPSTEPMGYWIDLSRPSIQNIMKSHVNILTTLERRAQSICTRNVIAHHPACGGAYADIDADGNIIKTVYGIRKEQDPIGLERKINAIQNGEDVKHVFEDADVITVSDGSDSSIEDVLETSGEVDMDDPTHIEVNND